MKPTRLLSLVLVALVSISVAACAGKKKQKKKSNTPAAGGTETKKGPEPMTEAEKKVQANAMALMEKVGAAAVEHKDDCDALAAAWQKLWDDNKDLVNAATKIDRDSQKVAEWDKAYKDQKKAINEKLKPAFDKCSKHKAVVALLAKMKPPAAKKDPAPKAN